MFSIMQFHFASFKCCEHKFGKNVEKYMLRMVLRLIHIRLDYIIAAHCPQSETTLFCIGRQNNYLFFFTSPPHRMMRHEHVIVQPTRHRSPSVLRSRNVSAFTTNKSRYSYVVFYSICTLCTHKTKPIVAAHNLRTRCVPIFCARDVRYIVAA